MKITNEYLHEMGYSDAQSLIARHSDRQHSHMHVYTNRIGNDGKAINDHSEKYRFTKVCRELTERCNLTIGEGKQEVNRSRLRGEGKLCYEIFDTIKSISPQPQTWKDFVAKLEQQGITIRFKTKGNTNVVQGIIFRKDGCSFSGSRIDRSCSLSHLSAKIERNIQQRQCYLSKKSMAYSINESGFASGLSNALGEVFTMLMLNGSIDVDELRFQKKFRNRANRKHRI